MIKQINELSVVGDCISIIVQESKDVPLVLALVVKSLTNHERSEKIKSSGRRKPNPVLSSPADHGDA